MPQARYQFADLLQVEPKYGGLQASGLKRLRKLEAELSQYKLHRCADTLPRTSRRQAECGFVYECLSNDGQVTVQGRDIISQSDAKAAQNQELDMRTLVHWQITFTDTAGNIRPGIAVTIRNEATGALAALFADIDGTTTKSNPITTDDFKYGVFYVEQGRYRIQADGLAAVAEAEAARDTAQFTSGIFDDTAEGLASTNDGDYFFTPSPNSDEFLILYRNDAGVTTKIETYPSTAGVSTVVASGIANHEAEPDPNPQYLQGDDDISGVSVTTATGMQMLADALDDRVIELKSNLVLSIPTDYPNWQSAIDDLSSKYRPAQGVTIDLVGETGWQPSTGVEVTNGDYRHFRLSHAETTVVLDPAFPAVDIIKGDNAYMPVLNCLIDANGRGLNGYFANNASTGYVTAGSGIDKCQQQGCYAHGGSTIFADNSIFTNASALSDGFSGYLAWGSTIYAESGNANGSGYYGAQAAASGLLNFRGGTANGAARHGIRGTNMGIVNARSSSANNCGVTGYRAFDSGIIHATNGSATGSLSNAVQARNNGVVTFDNAVANATGSVLVAIDSGRISAKNLISTAGSIRAVNKGSILLDNPNVTASGTRPISAAFGSEIMCNGGSISGGDGNRAVNLTTGSKVIFNETNITLTGGGTLAVIDKGSDLQIYGGAHSYPGDAVNLLNGSFLRLHGSGIPAGDVSGMANNSLGGRGIMWGAS